MDHLGIGILLEFSARVDELSGLQLADIVPLALDVGTLVHYAPVEVLYFLLDPFALLIRLGGIEPAHGGPAALFIPADIVLYKLDVLLPPGDGFLLGLLLVGKGISHLLLARGLLVKYCLGSPRVAAGGIRIVGFALPSASQTYFRQILGVGGLNDGLLLECFLQVVNKFVRDDSVILPFVLVESVIHGPQQRSLEEDARPKNTVSIVGGQFVVFLFPLGITGILLVLVRRVGYLELPHQVHRHHGDGHDRRFGVVGLESAV